MNIAIAASPRVHPEDVATCVSCGLCLNDCPTYRLLGNEADSPRGRIQLIRSLMATDAAPAESVVGHLDACLVCRACETACPSLVPFGRIMEGAREEVAARRRERGIGAVLRRAALDIVTHRRLLAALVALATLYDRTGLRGLVRRVLPSRLRALESLVAPAEGAAFTATRPGGDAQLFTGCVMSAAFGETQRATVRALERSGHQVGAAAGQTCCGALHAHAGLGDRARALARANVRALGGTSGPIVVTAAGCGAHLRAYDHVLEGDAAAALAARVRDASEVVRPAPPARALARRVRVVYQDACHLAHGQGVRRQPRDLLRAIEGVEVVPIADPERCCGSAGVYNVTHPEIATRLQRAKVEAILGARPDVVVSANPGCILQVRAGLREAGSAVPVLHLMRFLDDPEASIRGARN